MPWLRARASKPRTSSNTRTAEPWWVSLLTDFGRPLVAIIVMVMCAPGEHHLGVLAGWDTHLAWGMAAVLAAYAGIASVVATRRPKRAPGKRSAVAGAITALLCAMAAQPVSHAFVTGWLSATPRSPLWLVVIVSCVPPLVLGHLLHLAATPVAHPVAQPESAAEQPEPTAATEVVETAPESAPPVSMAAPTPVLPISLSQPPAAITGRIPAPASKPSNHLLTTRDVAELKGVSTSTVGTWVGRGKLTPAFRDAALGNLFDPASLN
jgi:hypothetical protein